MNELALFSWRELSVKYDRSMCSWKTHRHLFIEDLQPSSVTLPKWGMLLDGVCWELTTGLWPTPTVSGNHNRKGARINYDTQAAEGDG